MFPRCTQTVAWILGYPYVRCIHRPNQRRHSERTSASCHALTRVIQEKRTKQENECYHDPGPILLYALQVEPSPFLRCRCYASFVPCMNLMDESLLTFVWNLSGEMTSRGRSNPRSNCHACFATMCAVDTAYPIESPVLHKHAFQDLKGIGPFPIELRCDVEMHRFLRSDACPTLHLIVSVKLSDVGRNAHSCCLLQSLDRKVAVGHRFPGIGSGFASTCFGWCDGFLWIIQTLSD